ncbi:TlpA family protein disulfide reductase [Mucilaginibacter myungsuensis]|uniref:TlpA family protein disulfide reductase n=1 Tax=Mucilaginibacter myungsuensis TaxID=649104 RepID=A0A929KWT0_9SPHI|nr:TlpA disulfide reductase family protein [Mucilaginibacter myungsuensis]MBE9662117.1 TlpA family protein disulfide reductase [Mucilaginibacter myungsuensis]MDN3599449.1 TlpA disulfide reductase family protein [Mucilaginibacter myungsuensis]
MKKYLTILFLLTSTISFAQSNTATISGKFAKRPADTVLLINYAQLPTKIPVAKDGTFSSTFKIDSGQYYRLDASFVYLAPQMVLTMNVNGDSLSFSGKGSVENKVMVTIEKSMAKYIPFKNGEYYGKVLDIKLPVFLKQMDDYKANSLKLIAGVKGASKFYNKTQQQQTEYLIRSALHTYRTRYGKDPAVEKEYFDYQDSLLSVGRQPDSVRSMEYQKKMRVLKLSAADDAMLNSKIWDGFDMNNVALYKTFGVYNTMLEKRLDQLTQAEGQRSPEFRSKDADLQKFLTIDKEISNPFVKDIQLYMLMRRMIRAGDKLTVNYNRFMAAFTDDNYKAVATKTYNKLQSVLPGQPSPLFVYNDPSDKPLALKDLQGSYVYIDVWATWCGPCKAEIPSLKMVEGKYHDKNIKFVSVSVDAMKDLGTWKNFIKDNQLGGIQVITEKAAGSAFIQEYNINSIPRFILIDPQGNIVSADAPRPSDPELVKLLDKSLAAN